MSSPPYIFIVAVEVLLIKLTSTKLITGITFGCTEGRAETFADDTTIYFERTPENLRNAIKCLQQFALISGLQCNLEKTSVIPIGLHHDITEENTLCPELELKWETEFTILGFVIDNKLQRLDKNFDKCDEKVKTLIIKWRAYNLSINGRITIAKAILLPQYTYIGSVLDKISKTRYAKIQKTLDYFVLHNSYLEPSKSGKNWIKPEILYEEKNKGGYGQIKVTDFFKSIKSSWIKRYASGKLDDHWCDILDREFELQPGSREKIYSWGRNKFSPIIAKKFPCISEFMACFQEFCKFFYTEPNPRENRWLQNPFFNNPRVQYGPKRNRKIFTPG